MKSMQEILEKANEWDMVAEMMRSINASEDVINAASTVASELRWAAE